MDRASCPTSPTGHGGRALYQSFPVLGEGRAQVWAYSPQYRRPRHFHAEPELNLVVSGIATFGVGDAIVHAERGDLIVFPPGQDHVLLRGSPDLALFAIAVRPTLFRDLRPHTAPPSAAPLRVRLIGDAFRTLVKRSADAAERGDIEQEIAELWQAAESIRAASPASPGNTLHVLTRRAMACLAASPELGRSHLARSLRSTPTEISRHFRRDVGMTLVQYRTRLRLLRFIEAVDACGDNFTAAALSAGFGSYSQCHRTFQSAFGCTPSLFFGTALRAQMETAFEPAPGHVGDEAR